MALRGPPRPSRGPFDTIGGSKRSSEAAEAAVVADLVVKSGGTAEEICYIISLENGILETVSRGSGIGGGGGC